MISCDCNIFVVIYLFVSESFLNIRIQLPRYVPPPGLDFGDCKGSNFQPLRIGPHTTTNERGSKIYEEKDVNTLSRRLMIDMPGLSSQYARVIAEDALNIDENFQVTYGFLINTGTSTLLQFKVVSTVMTNHKVSFKWLITRVKVTYTAQLQNIIHTPARRRINFLNRRRCSYQHINRGLTNSEVRIIHSHLTAIAKKIGSESSVFARMRVTNPIDGDTCSAWKPVVQLVMDRTCIKLP